MTEAEQELHDTIFLSPQQNELFLQRVSGLKMSFTAARDPITRAARLAVLEAAARAKAAGRSDACVLTMVRMVDEV